MATNPPTTYTLRAHTPSLAQSRTRDQAKDIPHFLVDADELEKGKSSVVGEDESSLESPLAARPASAGSAFLMAQVVDDKAAQKNRRVGHFECPLSTCGRVYKRKGDLKVHMVKKHKETETQVFTEIMKPRSSAEGKTYICPYLECGETHGYLRMRGLRRHLTLKHGGKLPRDLIQTDQNAYLFRSTFARKSHSSGSDSEDGDSSSDDEHEHEHEHEHDHESASSMSKASVEVSKGNEALVEQVDDQTALPINDQMAVEENEKNSIMADIRTSKRVRKPKVRDSPDHPFKKRKYTRRTSTGEESEAMTLKIPSTLIEDLRQELPPQFGDNAQFEEAMAMTNLAHVAVPATAITIPDPQQPYYPNYREANYGFIPQNPQMYGNSQQTYNMLPSLGRISYPYTQQSQPRSLHSDYVPMMYFPQGQLSPAMQSLKAQLPSITLPPMLPPLTSNISPQLPEGLPSLVFGSSSPKSTGILINETYLPPAPLTSYLHSLGPFNFSRKQEDNHL